MSHASKQLLRSVMAVLMALAFVVVAVGGALAHNEVVQANVANQEFVPAEEFFRVRGDSPPPEGLLLPAVQSARE